MKKIYIAAIVVLAIGVGVSGGLLARKSSTKSAATPAGTTATSDHMSMAMSADSLKTLTGNAYDKQFITMMSEHHAGAIAMASYVNTSNKPEIKQLAENIISTQTKELADMKSWAMKYGYDYTAPSQESIDANTISFAGKTGDALDKQFLTDMLGHHQGALDMAQYSAKNAKHQEIKTLSANIIKTQTGEITLMKSLQTKYGYVTASESTSDSHSMHQ